MVKKSLMPDADQPPPAAPALEPEPDVAPEDTFTSYKLRVGEVLVAVDYYNQQMLVHGHAANWATAVGLELLAASHDPGLNVIRITCRAKE